MNSDTRTPLPKRLRTSSATTTQVSRRSEKTLQRFRFRDRLGELAAAFDGLAETLKEEGRPQRNNKAAFKDPAEWLAALSRFNGALRACPDLSSIERVLVETVEEVFPACAIELRWNDKSGGIALFEGYRLADGLLGIKAQVEPTREPSAQTKSPMPAQSRDFPCSLKVESSSKQGWISYVTVPLLARGQALGALSVYGREREELSSMEGDFLNIVADQAALAIDKLRVANQATEQRVELPHDKEALATFNGAKSDFVSILSHEFRTPLNLIMGYTEMMHEELMGKITPEQGTCLERIMKASDDLLALVMNMLQVGNIESGCVEINKAKVEVGQLLREIQADFVLPEGKKLKPIWDIPPDLPILSTDADKLKQVLQQLIANAVKFTEHGHVMVSSRSALPAARVEIAVSDTGAGIPEQVLPVLFEKYRQLDSSIARIHDGMGLGLFIAKKLTEALGGELNVTSHPGIGSTFTVVLPLGI
ncbi:MAG: GAF domain-containing sensor histidine kinase [Alphaproteobacteria bacterium]